MKNKGFTLLELLVVMGIIAILVSLAAVSYSSAQKSSRDSRRRSDMKTVQNALEQYYAANQFSYGANGTCDGIANAAYLEKGAKPIDPGAYTYYYNCVAAVPPAPPSYCTCAHMESTGSGNSSGNNCDFAGGDYYCVKNLQ